MKARYTIRCHVCLKDFTVRPSDDVAWNVYQAILEAHREASPPCRADHADLQIIATYPRLRVESAT